MAKLPEKPKKGRTNDITGNGVIYARYSSHNQKDISIEQQVEQCVTLAEEYGITITNTYSDRGISGRTTDQRVHFRRMLKDAEKGAFQYVISWKSSRIGRNMLEAMINEARLQECGVRILYVEEDFDDTAAGRFAARSMMNVNQFYSENMAEDVRRGMDDNAMKCLCNGPLPFGYRRDENLRIVLDEHKAQIVQEIFTRIATGDKKIEIVNDLNKRGIKTGRGTDWNKNSFSTLLKNERYRGIYIFGNIRIDNGIPRIVSDEIFFKAQEVMSLNKQKGNTHGPRRRKRNTDIEYLLTGKLFCGECGAPMTGMSGTGKSKTVHYYYSCNNHRYKKTCGKANVKKDLLENAVATAIKEKILTDENIKFIADKTIDYYNRIDDENGISILQNELADVEKSIQNVMKAIEQGIITPTTKSRLMELEAEQSNITSKITALRADSINITQEDIVKGLSMYKDGEVSDKDYLRSLFDTFLVAVYVFDDRIEIEFSYNGGGAKRIILSMNTQDDADIDVRVKALMPHQLKASFVYRTKDAFCNKNRQVIFN